MSDTNTPAPAEAGQPQEFADFAALDEQAHQLEGVQERQAAQAAAQQQQEAAENTAAELLSALEMARLMAAPAFAWWPDFAKVWSDRTLQGIAEGGAAVMAKHGWTMGAMFSEFGPYIALVGATVPPCLVTYQAVKQRKQEGPSDERPQPPKD